MNKLILLLISAWAFSASIAQVKLTIKIVGRPEEHLAEELYIAGNFNGWNPSQNKFSGGSILLQNLKADIYEFKITRGSWDKVEVAKNGADVANHSIKLIADTVIELNIDGWKDDFAPVQKKHTASANVKLLDSAFYIPKLKRSRTMRIYLPENYSATTKRFPVLYMHDGQNLFDEYTSGYGEWGVDEALDSMNRKTGFACIVVGIDNGPKRMNEYNPYDNPRFGAGEGSEYVDFIVKTLKPYIDKHFRTKADKPNTAIAGSSMGGLISCYAILKYPQTFGLAGVFSPAFWTAPVINQYASTVSNKFNGKVFFYMGSMESAEMIPDMKKVEEALKLNTKAKLKTVINDSGRHNEAYWRAVFPDFINFWMKK